MQILTNSEMQWVAGGAKICASNNGWGNGDDAAPGNSLMHNRAENNVRPGAAHKGTPAQPLTLDDGCAGVPPSP
jgi:hypothetical protein